MAFTVTETRYKAGQVGNVGLLRAGTLTRVNTDTSGTIVTGLKEVYDFGINPNNGTLTDVIQVTMNTSDGSTVANGTVYLANLQSGGGATTFDWWAIGID